MKMIESANIDEYISQFPSDTQKLLLQVRTTIKKAAPGTVEAIKYGIPTFMLNGKNLVHFGGFDHHIGFYPAPTGLVAFKAALAKFKQGKGSVQFPLDKPMPHALITRIVKYRLKESLAKVKSKPKK
jgi:uncharacterized protein YdhG (YjbR/CyaY superfamily)